MAKECAITKKSSQVGGGYSNPTGLRRRYANLQKKKIYVPEVGKTFHLTVSTRGLKTITKNGAFRALKEAGIIK